MKKFKWVLKKDGYYRCVEGIVYADGATDPECQCINIYTPAAYVNHNGTMNYLGYCGRYKVRTAPVVFHSNADGEARTPPASPDSVPGLIKPFLKRGFVFISCGCRGRESGDDGSGSPWTLTDTKTAIGFVRHHAERLPGSFERIICVGAGRAVPGRAGVVPEYQACLEHNGAFVEESNAVYAPRYDCHIIDQGCLALDHAANPDRACDWIEDVCVGRFAQRASRADK